MHKGAGLSNFELYRAGGAEVLKDIAANAIHDLGREVAAAAGDEAVLNTHTSDRAVATVSVPASQQARDGVLTRAAAAAGLEVRAR